MPGGFDDPGLVCPCGVGFVCKTTVIIMGDRPRWNSGFELILDNK
jgi:hypothetical protein